MPHEGQATLMLTQNRCLDHAGLSPEDLDEIVEKYRGMLVAIGHQFRLTPEEREDATQSTWLQLFRNVEQIRDADRVGGWLATTMRRQCIAARRRRYLENPMSDLPEAPPDSAASDVVDTVAHRHAVRRLHEAVDRLPDRERRLMRLQLDPAQPRYAEISRCLGMPVGSIGPIRGRALRKLRTLLRDLEPDEQPAFAG
jgi:RNA polymerase sigma factor (sigma-70 family)